MIIILAVLAVMCGGLIWLAESRDRPRRRAERLANMVQPAE
jgi:hypothetical protein